MRENSESVEGDQIDGVDLQNVLVSVKFNVEFQHAHETVNVAKGSKVMFKVVVVDMIPAVLVPARSEIKSGKRLRQFLKKNLLQCRLLGFRNVEAYLNNLFEVITGLLWNVI